MFQRAVHLCPKAPNSWDRQNRLLARVWTGVAKWRGVEDREVVDRGCAVVGYPGEGTISGVVKW